MGEETGNDKAVEAIKIKLSGEASSEYHVYILQSTCVEYRLA